MKGPLGREVCHEDGTTWSPRSRARTWWQAVRAPWIAAVSLAPSATHTPDDISFGTFLEGWGQTISDERGMRVSCLWGVLSLPVLEVLGAWLGRGKLLQGAVRRSRGTCNWSAPISPVREGRERYSTSPLACRYDSSASNTCSASASLMPRKR